jgi:hypothetical protein
MMLNGGRLWKSGYGIPRLVLVTLAMAVMIMPAVPTVEAEGPLLYLHEPADGVNLTTREVTVEGCSTARSYSLNLGSAELGGHPGANMAWESGALVMRPVESFSEGFSGSSLNTTKWTFLRDSGSTGLDRGRLIMRSSGMPGPLEEMGQIRSPLDVFPDGMDWSAELRLSINRANEKGIGGGITPGSMNLTDATVAVMGRTQDAMEHLMVFAEGSSAYLGPNDRGYHTYRADYGHDSGETKLYMDNSLLTTFEPSEVPSYILFGPENGTYNGSSRLQVDFVRIWTYTGDWQSRSFDFGHHVSVDDLGIDWTSTEKPSAEVIFDVRASDDNASWSQWMPASNVTPLSSLNCSYMQLRVNTSMNGVRDELANVSVRSFDVTYHDPVVSVEARTTTGDWVMAEGIDVWNVTLDLEEDLNVVQVRAIDTSGATNLTSINVTVDTTPPVGTVSIVTDSAYLSDPDVNLSLNASDRYGVATVQVSSAPTMDRMKVLPYCTTIPWQLEGLDGEVSVFVRFVDTHGLTSEIVHDSVILDNLDPSGSVVINDGVDYTSSPTVRLDVEYADNRGVETVEVSNLPDMSDALTLEAPRVTVDDWELLDGDDGPRTVYMRVTDVAGNVVVVSSTIELYIPKALGNVTIEGGSPFTGASAVQLIIDIPMELGARLMQLSNEPSFEGATWEPVAPDRTWILSEGDGHKTVYMRFDDFRGFFSLPVTANITVDTTPPEAELIIAEGKEYITELLVTVELVAQDATSGVSQMRMSNADDFTGVSWSAYQAMTSWTFPEGEGMKTLYVQVMDEAGLMRALDASVILDTTAPSGFFIINGRDEYVQVSLVTLTLDFQDPFGPDVFRVSDSPDLEGSQWVAYAPSLSWDLPEEGHGTVYMEVRDDAGNVAAFEASIIYDATPPTVEVLSPTEEATKEGHVTVEVSVSDAIDQSPVVEWRLGDDPWKPMEGSTARIKLSDGDNVITIRAIDAAGNEAVQEITIKKESEPSEGSGLFLLIAIVIAVAVIGVAFWMLKGRSNT